MNAKPKLARPHAIAVAAAAFFATLVTAAALLAVTGLFHSRGLPMEQIAIAERACAAHAYISDRDICIREQLAASRGITVARP